MRDLHWSLDSLPPRLRAQAERQLGVASTPVANANAGSSSEESNSRPRAFAVPGSTTPKGSQEPRRRRGGVYKANALSAPKNAPQSLLEPSPAGFSSIAQVREGKKAKKRRKTLTPDMAPTLVKSCEKSPDGNEVRFILGCSPYMVPTAQEKKIAMIGGRPRLYKQAKVQKAEKTITLAMTPHAYLFKGWSGSPIGVWIDFCYEYPQSTPKKDLVDFRYSQQKNDLDNSNKGLQDALTAAGFWEDDSLIAELHLRKFRVLTAPRIVITVRRLPQVAPGADLLSPKKPWFFKDNFNSETDLGFEPGEGDS